MVRRSALRVGVAQLNSRDDIKANLDACWQAASQAAAQRASLLVLPENFAFFGPDHARVRLAEQVGGAPAPIQEALMQMARQFGLTLVAGGFPERSACPGRPYNSCLVVRSDGSLGACYRKIHLFDVELPDGTRLRESDATLSGRQVVVAEESGWHLGLSICYDLRFPELYRQLVVEGAEVLCVPAAFTEQTGRDHWRPLLQARAIESQCWLLAAAQWGQHPQQRRSYGHAMIIDPWGTVVAALDNGVGVVVAELDPRYQAQIRQAIPCLQHRQLSESSV